MPPDDDERDIGSPDPEDDQKESKLAPDDDKKHKGGLQFDDDDDEPRTGGLQIEFDDEPRKDGLQFDDEPLTAGAVEKLPPIDDKDQPPADDKDQPPADDKDQPPADDKPTKGVLKFDDEIEIEPDDESGTAADDEPSPGDVQKPLEEAKDLLHRARLVSDLLFKEARNMPEYRRVLATPVRNAQFKSKLLARAKAINSRLRTGLSNDALTEAVERLANRIAAWEHSPKRQQERQKKQVAARRKKTYGRDLQIVHYIENGESQRRVAARLGTTRGVVENVLRRDAPHLLKRSKPPRLPD